MDAVSRKKNDNLPGSSLSPKSDSSVVDFELVHYWLAHSSDSLASQLRFFANSAQITQEDVLVAAMCDGDAMLDVASTSSIAERLSDLTTWPAQPIQQLLAEELPQASEKLLERYIQRTHVELGHTRDVRRWLLKHGGYMHPSLAISSVTPTGSRGLIAMNDIPASNEPLLVVPQFLELSSAKAFAAVIVASSSDSSDPSSSSSSSSSSISSSSNNNDNERVTVETLLETGLSGDATLLVALLVCLEAVQGSASTYAPILKLFPTTPPCAWYPENENETEDTLHVIFESLMAKHGPKPDVSQRLGARRAARARIDEEVQVYKRRRKEAKRVVREMADELMRRKHDYAAVSRKLHRAVGKRMIAIKDGSGFREVSEDHIRWSIATVLSRSNVASPSTSEPLFVPVMDLVNHRSDCSHIRVEESESLDQFLVRAREQSAEEKVSLSTEAQEAFGRRGGNSVGPCFVLRSMSLSDEGRLEAVKGVYGNRAQMLKEDRERRSNFESTKDVKFGKDEKQKGASAYDRHMAPRALRAGEELCADYMNVASYSPVDELDRYGVILPETWWEMGFADNESSFRDVSEARNYELTGAPSDAVLVEVGENESGRYVRPLHPENEAVQVDEYYPPGWKERVMKQRRRRRQQQRRRDASE
ncbi:SET domain-containing protein [Pseudoscourfieldia marina]